MRAHTTTDDAGIPSPQLSESRRRRWVAIVIGLVALGGVGGAIQVSRALRDPDTVYLAPDGGAQWIRHASPTRVERYETGDFTAWFRVVLDVPSEGVQAVVSMRALRTASAYLDGEPVYEADENLEGWKDPKTIDLSNIWTAGTHELSFEVLNRNGHPALLVHSAVSGLSSGSTWETSADGNTWAPAQVLDGPPAPIDRSRDFPSASDAFLSVLPWTLAAFVVGVTLALAFTRMSLSESGLSGLFTPETLRWLVLAAWSILAISNLIRYPWVIGFDPKAHFEYIEYVRRFHRIPLATEGWQMFQSPLYYIVAAIPFALVEHMASDETLSRIFRLIPLLCGLGLVEITFRTVRRLYPERGDLQAFGILLAGGMPLTIYMAHGLGNEPMAAFFSGLACLLVLPALLDSTTDTVDRNVVIGVVLGLAILTKVTAVLLLPPTFLMLFYARGRRGTPAIDQTKRFAAVLVPILIVSGWYYARNWMLLGRPFVGGWDASRGVLWWQDPGYRNLAQFTTFGESLAYPIQAAMVGVWDGLYSTFWLDGFISGLALDSAPPWNMRFMIAGAWLAFPLTAATLAGCIVALWRFAFRDDGAAGYVVLTAGLYTLTIVYLFLVLPAYSTGKASYAMGVLPLFVMLALYGVEPAMRWPFARACVFGLSCAWAFASYCAYFIV